MGRKTKPTLSTANYQAPLGDEAYWSPQTPLQVERPAIGLQDAPAQSSHDIGMAQRNSAPSPAQTLTQLAIDRDEVAREQRIMIQEANEEMDARATNGERWVDYRQALRGQSSNG
jgi:hypothetical protein